MHESHVSVIESRARGVDAETALRLARALDVDPDWLIFGGEEPKLDAFDRETPPDDPEPAETAKGDA
jgi:hypothetical protein